MTAWLYVLGACAIAYAIKLAGYLAPDSSSTPRRCVAPARP